MLVAYAPDLSGYHEIRAESLQTEELYNGIGKFTLVVPPTDYNIAHIKHRSVLYRTDTGTSLIVSRLAPDTSQSRITINGYTSNELLNKRTFATAATIATVEVDLYAAIAANLRGLPDVQIATVAGLTEAYAAVLYGGQITDTVIPILDAVGLGHRMRFDTRAKKHIFEIYKGVDRTTGATAAVFSDEQGTARDLKIEDDESTFKNVCYVTAVLADDTPIVEVVGDAVGADRFELWAEARGLKQETGETEAAFRVRLADYGLAQLAKYIRRTSFSVRVDDGRYGTAYNMGDIVTCVSKRFGMQFSAVIKGVKRTIDRKSETVNLVLGDPILTVLGEIKLWQR